MCIFTSDKDIPGHVRLSTRTLQYLIIPMLSLALLSVGVLHLPDCPGQPLLPVWHIVAGSTGLLVPLLYLLFDDLNPALAARCPGLSEALDNVVVFVLPVYILFEICWLVTGAVWVAGVEREQCGNTVYMFSLVVIINFGVHLLTPLLFMVILCCSKIGFCQGFSNLWGGAISAGEHWTRVVRISLVSLISVPLGLGMLGVGGASLSLASSCSAQNVSQMEISSVDRDSSQADFTVTPADAWPPLIPVWLLVSGSLVVLAPAIYSLYDVFCKQEEAVNKGVRAVCQVLVILYLLAGLAWTITGFYWIFSSRQQPGLECGHDSLAYWFAFASLITLNVLMDCWICFKICVILYWALVSEND